MGEVRQAVETATQAKKDGEERKTEIEELKVDLKSALDDNDEVSQDASFLFSVPVSLRR